MISSKMFGLMLVLVFSLGVRSQSDSLDFGDPSSVLSNAGKDIDLDKLRAIKKPEDIAQIKDWKDKCAEEHGSETVKEIEDAPNEVVKCVLQYVKPDKLQVEVNKSMSTGNLDRLFKKYCGYRNNILSCVDVMLDKFRTCMTPQQLTDVNVTRRAVDAAIDFTCHDDGDRIALFMAEKGVECLKEHRDSIQACVKQRVPQLQETVDDPNSLSLDSVVINEEQCGKINSIHQCVVQEATKCSDPTPANILDALITQMLKVTPCQNINTKKAQQLSSSSASASAVNSEAAASSGASSLSSLVKNSISRIGPLVASGCFSGVACASAALTSVWVLLSSVLLHAQTLCVLIAGAIVTYVAALGSFCYGAACSLLTAVGDLLSGAHSGLSFWHDALKSLLASLIPSNDREALQGGRDVWAFVLSATQQGWLLLCSSVSVLLVIALSAVTAANLLI